jgi:poly-gamma-glutamate synthesis protein (capsule biosynthesis protein)
LADTVAACTNAGLETVGVGESLAQATRPLWIEVKGIRLAILAFAENEFSIATPHSSGAWPVDPVNNFYQIKQAKQEAEFVLVMLHGGNEYYELPSPCMVKLCRYFVDVGADAVVCNHVHVPGGIEVYHGVPIVYSTGNFLFEGESKVDEWHQGFLVKLAIQPGAVVALQLIPYWQFKDQVGVRLMSHAEQGQFFAHLSEISSVIADPVALEEKWDRFVRSKRVQYLSSVLGLNRVERRLLRSGVWPFWRLRRSAGARLLNLFTCESHRDAMTSLLTSEFLTAES